MRRGILIAVVVSLGMLHWVPGAIGQSNPDQAALSIETTDVRLSFMPDKLADPRFQLLDKRTGQISSIKPSEPGRRVQEIHIVNRTRGVAISDYGLSGINVVTVLDFDNKVVMDEFLCLGPRLSPDGQLIAYVKFFPQHFVRGTSSEYLVYNLSATAAQNRVAAQSEEGIAIYPLGSRNLTGDNVGLADSQVHEANSPLSWIQGKNILAFTDRQDGKTNLIVTDLRRGIVARVTVVKPLDDAVHATMNQCQGMLRGVEFTVASIVVDPSESQNSVNLEIRAGSSRCGVLIVPLTEISLK